jgi:hypothetical protein
MPGSGVISNTFGDLTPNTEYNIYAVPADIDGNLGEVVIEPVTTTPGGGSDIMPDFTATDIEGNTIHLYDILDAGQAVLINFFLTGDPYSEQPMPDMIEAYRLYGCNAHDVFFMEICPNAYDEACQAWADQFGVKYPTISRDGGGNDIAQAIPVGYYPTIMLIRPDHTFANRDIYPPTLDYIIDAMNAEAYEQHDCEDGVNQNDSQYIAVYPNPATDFVTLSGESLGTVRIYNALGQKVDEFEANGSELRINTAGYENGLYVVKAGKTTLQFVVKHQFLMRNAEL